MFRRSRQRLTTTILFRRDPLTYRESAVSSSLVVSRRASAAMERPSNCNEPRLNQEEWSPVNPADANQVELRKSAGKSGPPLSTNHT